MTSASAQLPATAEAMRRLVADGVVLPGDCVLYEYSRAGIVQRLIGRVQRRALRDLVGIPQDAPDGAVDPDPALPIGPHQLTAWRYTHAGMVYDHWLTVEQTTPRVRRLLWDLRLEGVRSAVIVRPLAACSPFSGLLRMKLRQAAVEGVEDELHGVRYPLRELAVYYAWSWGWRKLGRGGKFEDIFRVEDRNVCSGAAIDWWQRAGVPLGLSGLDTYPEAWYPARLLVDPRFQIVAHLSTEHTEGTEGERNTRTQPGASPSVGADTSRSGPRQPLPPAGSHAVPSVPSVPSVDPFSPAAHPAGRDHSPLLPAAPASGAARAARPAAGSFPRPPLSFQLSALIPSPSAPPEATPSSSLLPFFFSPSFLQPASGGASFPPGSRSPGSASPCPPK